MICIKYIVYFFLGRRSNFYRNSCRSSSGSSGRGCGSGRRRRRGRRSGSGGRSGRTCWGSDGRGGGGGKDKVRPIIFSTDFVARVGDLDDDGAAGGLETQRVVCVHGAQLGEVEQHGDIYIALRVHLALENLILDEVLDRKVIVELRGNHTHDVLGKWLRWCMHKRLG